MFRQRQPLTCPFCGEAGEMKRYQSRSAYTIFCPNNQCPVAGLETRDAPTAEKAWELWAERVRLPGSAARLLKERPNWEVEVLLDISPRTRRRLKKNIERDEGSLFTSLSPLEDLDRPRQN